MFKEVWPKTEAMAIQPRMRNATHTSSKTCVSFRKRPHRLWDTTSLLFSAHWGVLPRGQSGRGVQLTPGLLLIPRLKMREAILPLHARLQGCTGITLPLHAVYWCRRRQAAG